MGTRLRSLALLAGLTAATATSVVPQSSPSARSGTMEVSAVIRTASLQVLPVALSRFGLVASSGDTLVLATGRDGTGAMAVPAG